MRGVLFCSLFILASCGRELTPGTRLGDLRSFNPLEVDASEKQRLSLLCHALSMKANGLKLVPSQNLIFEVTQRGCGEKEGLEGAIPARVGVTIEVNSSSFTLKRADNGLNFVYPDVVTSTSGLMGEVCADIDKAVNPKKLPNGNLLFYTSTLIDAVDCNPGENESCLLLETAVPEGANFKVTTKEWMRIQMDPLLSRYGFFLERKTLSSELCALNHSSQTKVLLVP